MKFWESIMQYEKCLLREALKRNGWNISRTGSEIGLSLRSMRHKMIQHDLRKEREVFLRSPNAQAV